MTDPPLNTATPILRPAETYIQFGTRLSCVRHIHTIHLRDAYI